MNRMHCRCKAKTDSKVFSLIVHRLLSLSITLPSLGNAVWYGLCMHVRMNSNMVRHYRVCTVITILWLSKRRLCNRFSSMGNIWSVCCCFAITTMSLSLRWFYVRIDSLGTIPLPFALSFSECENVLHIILAAVIIIIIVVDAVVAVSVVVVGIVYCLRCLCVCTNSMVIQSIESTTSVRFKS